MTIWRRIGTVLTCVLALPASAGGAGLVERLADPVPLSARRDVLDGAHDARFLPQSPDQAVAVRREPSGTWLRVRADASMDEPVAAVFVPPGVVVTAFLPPGYAPQPRRIDRADGPLPRHSGRALVFELDAAAPPALLHVGEGRKRAIRVMVAESDDYRRQDIAYLRLATAIHTVLTVMVVSVFFVWTLLRHRAFLHYCGYMGSMLLFVLLQSGEGYALPGLRQLAQFGPPAVWSFALLATIFALGFTRRFIGLRRYTPRLDRAIGVFRAIMIGALLVLLLMLRDPPRWLPDVFNLLILAATVPQLAAAVAAAVRGSRYAAFFLVGWVPLVIATAVRAAQQLTWLPEAWWSELAFQGVIAVEAVVLSLGLADRTLAWRRERDAVRREAERDPLTGVLNRGALLAQLEHALANASDRARGISVLFLDLDHFKQVNDRHGHATGDACLRALVDVVRAELRDDDALGRYGGEEFVVVLRDAHTRNAEAVAERIRRRIERTPILAGGKQLRLTVSIGVAGRGGDLGFAPLLARADAALYRAKRDGRNRVVLADPSLAYAS